MSNSKKSAILCGVLLINLLTGCAKQNTNLETNADLPDSLELTEDSNSTKETTIFDFTVERGISTESFNKSEDNKEESEEEKEEQELALWCTKTNTDRYYIVDLEDMLKYYFYLPDSFINAPATQNALNKLRAMYPNIYYKKGVSNRNAIVGKALHLYFDTKSNEYIYVYCDSNELYISYSIKDNVFNSESHRIFDAYGNYADLTNYTTSSKANKKYVYYSHSILNDDEDSPVHEMISFFDKNANKIISVSVGLDNHDYLCSLTLENNDGKVDIELTTEEFEALRSIFKSYLTSSNYEGFINDNMELFINFINAAKNSISQELYDSLVNSLNSLVEDKSRILTKN